jgi:hypothetical protein
VMCWSAVHFLCFLGSVLSSSIPDIGIIMPAFVLLYRNLYRTLVTMTSILPYFN